jgi:hypothetical protein
MLNGAWWCRPAIPSTWEGRVGVSQLWGQPEQYSETLSQKKKKQWKKERKEKRQRKNNCLWDL